MLLHFCFVGYRIYCFYLQKATLEQVLNVICKTAAYEKDRSQKTVFSLTFACTFVKNGKILLKDILFLHFQSYQYSNSSKMHGCFSMEAALTPTDSALMRWFAFRK